MAHIIFFITIAFILINMTDCERVQKPPIYMHSPHKVPRERVNGVSYYEYDDYDGVDAVDTASIIEYKSQPRSRTGRSTEYSVISKSIPILVSKHVHPLVQRSNRRRRSLDENTRLLSHNVRNVLEEYAKTVQQYAMDVSVLSETLEFNEIILVRLSEHSVDESRKGSTSHEAYSYFPKKKIVLIVHALNTFGLSENETLSTYRYIFKLLNMYAKWVKNFDILFVPLANPDGAAALLRDDRWSKNYSPQYACNGVALDRNFGYEFSNHEENSCSPLYAGRVAFSERETKALRQVFEEFEGRIVAYFSVRAASDSADVMKGDTLLYPHGYISEMEEEDREKFRTLKEKIKNVTSQKFKVLKFNCESMFSWYGEEGVTGSSVDYAHSMMRVPYAFEALVQSYSGQDVAAAALNLVWRNVFDVVFHEISKLLLY